MLSPARLHRAVKIGLIHAAARVERAAKIAVHSPDNPYIGKAGYSVATGRLQASIGSSDVRGSGPDLEIAVGTPYGKTGARGGVFSRSDRVVIGGKVRRGRTGAKYAVGPRGGVKVIGGRNKSDPQIYGPVEERRHPFLGPALDNNRLGITRDLEDALETELSFGGLRRPMGVGK